MVLLEMATVVRDSIWGDVTLGDGELALIDTAAFQRLRRVRQLGFTDLVFPGANHTRFEHSIGVYHLSGVALDRLRSIVSVPDDAGRAFRAAALLHDIGHYPFSHAVEELEVTQVRRHEDIARDIITTGEVAAILERTWGVDPRRVAAFVAGPSAGAPVPDDSDHLLRAVLDSGLDIDKLDYLVRDARGANVPYGVVDVQRLISSLDVWRDADGRPQLAVDGKGVAALQSLVFAKHLMFATVYWHHTARAAVAMLLRALQEAIDGGLGAGELQGADDGELVAILRRDGMPAITRELGERLRTRRLYKRAVETGVDEASFDRLERLWFRPAQRRVFEDEIADGVGARPGDVLLDIPEPKRIVVELPVIVSNGEASEWDRVSGLSGDDLARFQRWVRKVRLFACDGDVARRVAASGAG